MRRRPPEILDKVARIKAIADRYGISTKAAGLQFALAQPGRWRRSSRRQPARPHRGGPGRAGRDRAGRLLARAARGRPGQPRCAASCRRADQPFHSTARFDGRTSVPEPEELARSKPSAFHHRMTTNPPRTMRQAGVAPCCRLAGKSPAAPPERRSRRMSPREAPSGHRRHVAHRAQRRRRWGRGCRACSTSASPSRTWSGPIEFYTEVLGGTEVFRHGDFQGDARPQHAADRSGDPGRNELQRQSADHRRSRPARRSPTARRPLHPVRQRRDRTPAISRGRPADGQPQAPSPSRWST